MKIVQINAVCGQGSTGKICVSVSELLNKNGIENYIFYSLGSCGYPNALSFSNQIYTKLQAAKARVFGNYGFNSKVETKRMIMEMERIRPDIVHLHNIHGHDCHLGLLAEYFKKNKIRVFWTFHDCWAFTGYCTHFTFEKCDKWKTQCKDCVQRKRFSLFVDRSSELYRRKKEAFSDVDLTIITPSQWLADLVKQSFLKEYPIRVIHNGIDLNVFKPTPGDFRQRYAIPESKHILLGVAFGWGVRKGLDVFIELARRLDGEKYQIVLVGTDDQVDRQLPENIISIHRTQNQKELAEIYTAADLFVNPTREENYPTVNMEAIVCGTPVLTFRTGGSPEIVDEQTGGVVECDDIDALEKEIVRLCAESHGMESACLDKGREFDMHLRFEEYIALYEDKQGKAD